MVVKLFILFIVALLLAGVWLVARERALTAAGPAASGTGHRVVLNAVGVGEITAHGAGPDGATGVSLRLLDGREAFIPDDRVYALLHDLPDRAGAAVLLDALLEPTATRAHPTPEERAKRMRELWESGTHLEQARYLAQVLDKGTTDSDVVLLLGCGHLVSEIAYVLERQPAAVDAQIEQRYPWLKDRLPPR